MSELIESHDETQSSQTDSDAVAINGNARDAVATVLSEFAEDDTSTFIRFSSSSGDTTTVEPYANYNDDAILLAGRVEYPTVRQEATYFDERVILQNTYQAKEMIDDAWDVAHPKYNGDHWHIEASETIEFISFALSRGFEVIARPALLADVGRYHCPCASCGDSYATAAELSGHLGGMANAGDDEHRKAMQRREE